MAWRGCGTTGHWLCLLCDKLGSPIAHHQTLAASTTSTAQRVSTGWKWEKVPKLIHTHIHILSCDVWSVRLSHILYMLCAEDHL